MRVGGLQLLFLVNEGGHVVDDAPVGNVLLDLGGLRLFRLQPVDRVSEEEDQDLQKPDPGGNHLLPRESLELLDVGGEEVVAGSKINLLVEEHIAVHELPDLGLVVVDISQHVGQLESAQTLGFAVEKLVLLITWVAAVESTVDVGHACAETLVLQKHC